MLNWMMLSISQKVLPVVKRFVREERGDEILEKAAVIAAITVAVLVIIVLAIAAAAALNKGTSWFQ